MMAILVCSSVCEIYRVIPNIINMKESEKWRQFCLIKLGGIPFENMSFNSFPIPEDTGPIWYSIKPKSFNFIKCTCVFKFKAYKII